mmetsp:Transcript_16553/g.29526  ORF Transcript_16553/g.29526 Transcript_16553/m.29526 type:complete len:203 (-) Transcript_16553:1522-2130(-)
MLPDGGGDCVRQLGQDHSPVDGRHWGVPADDAGAHRVRPGGGLLAMRDDGRVGLQGQDRPRVVLVHGAADAHAGGPQRPCAGRGLVPGWDNHLLCRDGPDAPPVDHQRPRAGAHAAGPHGGHNCGGVHARRADHRFRGLRHPRLPVACGYRATCAPPGGAHPGDPEPGILPRRRNGHLRQLGQDPPPLGDSHGAPPEDAGWP